MDSKFHRAILKGILAHYDRKVMNNTHRGEYVEQMIRQAPGADWSFPWMDGNYWAKWDLEHDSGCKI